MSQKDKVIEVLTEHFGFVDGEVVPDAHLVNDLGADNIDNAEIVLTMTETFDIEITDDQYESVKTVQDLVNLVDKLYDIPNDSQ